MKKHLLLFAFMLVSFSAAFSQASFTTGAIGVDINEYGKIELLNSAGIYQMWRTSILVGASETAVFDYQNDAENQEETVLVSNPLLSDYEIYGAFDNTYSELPPAVTVKLNAYGWDNGGFIIVKFNIANNEATALNAMAGLDIIPYIDEEDGFDSVTFISAEEVIRIHRGIQTNVGLKLLSAPLKSLYSFEYYDDYYVDSDYWNWMNYGSVQPLYPSSTEMGSVSIASQEPVILPPGESFDVYYAMAVGANAQEMLENIANAQLIYEEWMTSVKENSPLASQFSLGNSYPNPFQQTAYINYRLAEDGFASVKIYNAIGMEVATLVDDAQTAGDYTVPFNAENLDGGVYFCKLAFNGQVRTTEMLLIK